MVVAAPLTPFEGPAEIVTVPWPRNERSAVAGLKTTSYAENVVALAHAAERGAGEAVFANTAGNLCEGTGTNVFYVSTGSCGRRPWPRAAWPGSPAGCWWSGATSARSTNRSRCWPAPSEIFLASTTRDVQPVAVCDGRRLVAPGPVTRSAAVVWRRREAENQDP